MQLTDAIESLEATGDGPCGSSNIDHESVRPLWKISAHDTAMSGEFYTALRGHSHDTPALSATSVDALVEKMKAAFGDGN